MRHQAQAYKMAIAATALALSACGSITGGPDSAQSGQGRSVQIDGRDYQLDDDGSLVLTQAEYERLIEKGAVKRAVPKRPENALAVTPEELAVLMSDRAAFFRELEGKEQRADEVTALVKEGSLRKNVDRIAAQLGYKKVKWDLANDYFVAKPFAVAGLTRRAVLVNLMEDFPITISFDEAEDAVRFAKLRGS